LCSEQGKQGKNKSNKGIKYKYTIYKKNNNSRYTLEKQKTPSILKYKSER
jgi:hypothetical protein